jgi:photosystem II stability/assembly factor-like uncharacterized protein
MLFGLLAMIALPALQAQVYDPASYQALEWRNVGPFRGGRVTAVAGHPNQPFTYYHGATGGGVWKTTNAGRAWENVSDGFFGTGTIGAIAVAESDPNVIYVGTGESPIRGVTTSHGDGVYKSTDGGETWRRVGLEKTRQISKIAIHPADPDVVFVGAQGSPWAPMADRGVYRSLDGGETWERILFVNETTGASFLTMDMTNPRVVYVGMWDHQRRPWDVRSGGPGSGLYKTTDGGDTWQELTEGLPELMGNTGISVSRADPNRVYAMIEAVEGGVYRSDDAGLTWSHVNGDPGIRDRGWYYTHIFADPQHPDTVYVLAAAMAKSTDGGRTFSDVPTPHGDNHDLWINPGNNLWMVQGNDGGANVSLDGAQSWSRQDNQPTAQFYRVITDNLFPYNLYAGQQDNTSVRIASRSLEAGIGPRDWRPMSGGESAHLAFDADNPVLVYGTSILGTIEELNTATGERRSISGYPYFAGFRPGRELKYRFNWNAPVLVSQHDSSVIYHAAQMLLKSTNRGRSWVEVSPDLTRNESAKLGTTGGPIMIEGAGGEHYATLMYVAESPHSPDTIWAGSDDGLIHVTRDGGQNWTNVTPRRMPEAQVNMIEISPHEPAVAYAVATRYKFNDFTPMIYRTENYGEDWDAIVDGIDDDAFVRVVREDPARRGLLYAGTEAGVYVSFNDGEQWQSLQLNLPQVPVTDLRVHVDDLVAATQGRAFWILDDLTPLHQLEVELLDADAALYQPRPAVRLSPRPNRPGAGENPPSGAVIYYNLSASAAEAGSARLEIIAPDGSLLRHFTSDEPEPLPPSLVKGVQRPSPDPAMPSEAGMNRYVWDLRYPRYVETADTIRYVSQVPPLAAPGRYMARLSGGGETLEKTFEVVSDPRRAAIAAADWAERERLMRILMGMVNDVHKNTNRARSVATQTRTVIELTADRQNAAAIASIGEQLIDVLTRWENHVPQSALPNDVQDRIAYPTRLLSTQILHVIDAMDQDPPMSDALIDRVAQLQAQWSGLKAGLNQIFDGSLQELNALLRSSGVGNVIAR